MFTTSEICLVCLFFCNVLSIVCYLSIIVLVVCYFVRQLSVDCQLLTDVYQEMVRIYNFGAPSPLDLSLNFLHSDF